MSKIKEVSDFDKLQNDYIELEEKAKLLEKRVSSKNLNSILGDEFKVLDHGFIRVVDYMGDDAAIVQAARVSYGKGTKKVSEDEGLIRYLLRHRHCYHPSMEVLTDKGWIAWQDLGEKATFAVPDPVTKKLSYETLPVKSFDCDEELFCFHNNRMSYMVTNNHTMYFKPKYSKNYGTYKVQDMSSWGHFDSINNYKLEDSHFGSQESCLYAFLGFYLGDGYCSSRYVVEFHLKKKRKKRYLLDLLSNLGIEVAIHGSAYDSNSAKFKIQKPDWFEDFIDSSLKSKDKKLKYDTLTLCQASGLFEGLVNSDGHRKKDRPQISYSSSSKELLSLFSLVASLLGYSVKETDYNMVIAYSNKTGTTLESRKCYKYKEHYKGKVFCTTTSTGWLMVRGDSKSIGFVCGNTTPFEMCEIKFHIKMPLFVARQWIRHRTASVNEYSARYSVLDGEFYIPNVEQLSGQSTTNGQGKGDIKLSEEEAQKVIAILEDDSEHCYDNYKLMLNEDDEGEPVNPEHQGLARELARMNLPTNIYTQWYWKIDLHNLLHFLSLRADSHAQYEIRVYADLMLNTIVKAWCPMAHQAFLDYVKDGYRLSRMEVEAIIDLLADDAVDLSSYGMSKREVDEFRKKFGL